jgi:shikimate kinase
MTFRQLEKQVIRSLKTVKGHIIALGGGSLCDSDNQNMVQVLGLLVYLKVPASVIRYRLSQFPFEDFDKTYAERCAIFEQMADITWELHHG